MTIYNALYIGKHPLQMHQIHLLIQVSLQCKDPALAISRETFSFQPQALDKCLLPDFLKHLEVPACMPPVTLAIPAGIANPEALLESPIFGITVLHKC